MLWQCTWEAWRSGVGVKFKTWKCDRCLEWRVITITFTSLNKLVHNVWTILEAKAFLVTTMTGPSPNTPRSIKHTQTQNEKELWSSSYFLTFSRDRQHRPSSGLLSPYWKQLFAIPPLFYLRCAFSYYLVLVMGCTLGAKHCTKSLNLINFAPFLTSLCRPCQRL